MCESPQTACVWGWRGATSGIAQRMKQILDTGERSDILFAVGHQFVLSLGSDVFDTMFNGEVPETTEKMIELRDILPQAFSIVLKYLYTGVVEDLNLENALPTMYCAKKYGMPKLVDICAEYAIKKVDKSTCFTMLEAAKVLDADNLVTKCLDIVDIHCSELLQSQEFLQLRNEVLLEIFSRDTLLVNEDEVYKAAERWATNACRTNQLESSPANHRYILGEALFFVRFPLMNDVQLANGPVSTGLLLNSEVLEIYQFKYAAKKPDIPFSGTPRSSDIVFCDRRWVAREKCDKNSGMVAAGNVFMDTLGHLHLRLCPHKGIWKGAGLQLVGALGFGRYEFHIEGLDRLDPNVSFALYSHDNERVGIYFIKMPSGTSQNACNGICFSVRHPNCTAPLSVDTAHSDKVTGVYTRTTHSYHRKPDSVSFSSQRGHHRNSAAGELCNWSCDFRPNIPEKALPLFIYLLIPPGKVPSDGKEVEVLVHSFRFYPDE